MASDEAGHRARLRQKCDDKGYEALTDQELFELLLFSDVWLILAIIKKYLSYGSLARTAWAILLVLL